MQAPAESGQAEMDELVPLVSRGQTTSIQRLNRSLWSDTSAGIYGEVQGLCGAYMFPQHCLEVNPNTHPVQSTC